jgi:hypothetical protein
MRKRQNRKTIRNRNSQGNHSFDPFGSCPLVCIPHLLSYSLHFCSLWFLFPYVLWSPVHSGPVACIPQRFCFPFVCLSLIVCVPMLFLFPYIISSLCTIQSIERDHIIKGKTKYCGGVKIRDKKEGG